jgi:hypothetical protein
MVVLKKGRPRRVLQLHGRREREVERSRNSSQSSKQKLDLEAVIDKGAAVIDKEETKGVVLGRMRDRRK